MKTRYAASKAVLDCFIDRWVDMLDNDECSYDDYRYFPAKPKLKLEPDRQAPKPKRPAPIRFIGLD
jgi:hypothetical protein